MTDTPAQSTRSTTTDRHVVQYDRLDDEPLSVTVADAVASHVGTDVTDLPPLHYTVDTDALERLFEPRADGLRTGGSVTFEYCDCTVTVSAAGEVAVRSADQETP